MVAVIAIENTFKFILALLKDEKNHIEEQCAKTFLKVFQPQIFIKVCPIPSFPALKNDKTPNESFKNYVKKNTKKRTNQGAF